jgi:ketosteroid isomerase-like protein
VSSITANSANLELASEALDALDARDTERLIELSHPEVEWQSYFSLGNGGFYRGHDGLLQFLHDLGDAFAVVDREVEDAVVFAEVAVLVGRIVYRGHGSDQTSTSPAGWVLKFRDGKLLSFRAFHGPTYTSKGAASLRGRDG